MPPATNASFRNWLKSNNNMKLSVASAVTRITYEGVTSYSSLLDFDKASIESLSKACKQTIPAIEEDEANDIQAEPVIQGANISTISIRRLIVAMQAVLFYKSIGREPTDASMHYTNVLSNFRDDYENFKQLKKQDKPETPVINDKDREEKVIKWSHLFEDALSRTFGARGPLIYVIRDCSDVPSEDDDPLEANAHYGSSEFNH